MGATFDFVFMDPRLHTFTAADAGFWRIREVRGVTGQTLPGAGYLDVSAGMGPAGGQVWQLRGIRSNERYTTREEKAQLLQKQEGLGRAASTFAALIPIRKTEAWWQLSQDERREIFEGQSRHTTIGLRYLPAIARRLYHCRDLGDAEPFDFLTWFEYRPEDEPAFDDLVAELRASLEWTFVEREVDVRLER